MMVSGGLRDIASVRHAFEQSGAAAVLLARGSLGNPWLFAQLVGSRPEDQDPTREEILAELGWVIERAIEHLGEERATRYLRKVYPWYVERLGGTRHEHKELQATVQTAPSIFAAMQALRAALPSGSAVATPRVHQSDLRVA
jgi:tRNA-dihydrouridine synthase